MQPDPSFRFRKSNLGKLRRFFLPWEFSLHSTLLSSPTAPIRGSGSSFRWCVSSSLNCQFCMSIFVRSLACLGRRLLIAALHLGGALRARDSWVGSQSRVRLVRPIERLRIRPPPHARRTFCALKNVRQAKSVT